jgi:hypothetical protein
LMQSLVLPLLLPVWLPDVLEPAPPLPARSLGAVAPPRLPAPVSEPELDVHAAPASASEITTPTLHRRNPFHCVMVRSSSAEIVLTRSYRENRPVCLQRHRDGTPSVDSV